MMKRILLFILILFLSSSLSLVLAAESEKDTTFHFLFDVNMSKTIKTGLFDPDSDRVYVVFEEALPEVLLTESPGNIYSGVVIQGLDSGVTYHFRFRINDTVYESVNRTAIANQGTTGISVWWNDDPLNITTFRVNMIYMAEQGLFDPSSDTVDIAGTMNDWQGSPGMMRIDTTFIYEISYWLNVGETYQYKFRIRHDSVRYENLQGINRFLRAPDTLITVLAWFDNFNPAAVPVTFDCRMQYMISSGQFDPGSGYLDIAGNFNGWGDYTLLYPTGYDTISGSDSLYRVTVFLDTTLIGGPPLEFRFRINASWELAELRGKDPRTYTIHDPLTPNDFSCWYDNLDPAVPTRPWVTEVEIQGHRVAGAVLTGMYSYHNLNGIPEGQSLYQWYRADSLGAPLIAIDSAWTINYTADSTADVGKHLAFEVTPVAASGDSATGFPVVVITSTPIGSVGIPWFTSQWLRIYPNPVSEYLVIESQKNIRIVEVFSLTGILQNRAEVTGAGKIILDVSAFPSGLYILRITSEDNRFILKKFIKQ
jgi:hypothetical protein